MIKMSVGAFFTLKRYAKSFIKREIEEIETLVELDQSGDLFIQILRGHAESLKKELEDIEKLG